MKVYPPFSSQTNRKARVVRQSGSAFFDPALGRSDPGSKEETTSVPKNGPARNELC